MSVVALLARFLSDARDARFPNPYKGRLPPPLPVTTRKPAQLTSFDFRGAGITIVGACRNSDAHIAFAAVLEKLLKVEISRVLATPHSGAYFVEGPVEESMLELVRANLTSIGKVYLGDRPYERVFEHKDLLPTDEARYSIACKHQSDELINAARPNRIEYPRRRSGDTRKTLTRAELIFDCIAASETLDNSAAAWGLTPMGADQSLHGDCMWQVGAEIVGCPHTNGPIYAAPDAPAFANAASRPVAKGGPRWHYARPEGGWNLETAIGLGDGRKLPSFSVADPVFNRATPVPTSSFGPIQELDPLFSTPGHWDPTIPIPATGGLTWERASVNDKSEWLALHLVPWGGHLD